MTLWTSSDIAKATDGKSSGAFPVIGLSIDSRTTAPGDLFIALKGPNSDGHDWVRQALESGAAGALVHKAVPDVNPDQLIMVSDTFTALHALGQEARSRFGGRVVGVTGSVGKTSTKDMLAHILGNFGPTHAAFGSFNNHWGVPVTLARMPADARYSVVEMGMNHAGELRALTALARPDIAIITWVSDAHLEFFRDVSEIADAKAEILEGVQTGGTAILPRDNPFYERLEARARDLNLNILTFGQHGEADVRLLDLVIGAEQTEVSVRLDREGLNYTIGAPGAHWARNSLAALAVVHALGLDTTQAARTLATLVPSQGRGRTRIIPLPDRRGCITLIDESYNANPASVRAALEALAAARPGPGGRRIAALGDMRELGPTGPERHAALAKEIVELGIEQVYTAGPLMMNLHEALPPAIKATHAVDSATLASSLAPALKNGDVLMVKGSFSTRMGHLVSFLEAMTDSVSEAT